MGTGWKASSGEHWASRSAFVFAAVGSAIGLGNVWRFPRICAQNGGFAFLIAFVVALFTAGIPILILELAMGERSQRATPGAFKRAHRHFEFLGWCIVGVGFLITAYYAIVMSWCCSYTVFSFSQSWGDDPAGFFVNEFLHRSDAKALPGGWGHLSGAILIGSVVSWLAVMACIWKGVKTVSKIVPFTVIGPWVLLLLFVARGLTLDGAWIGLRYYLVPQGEWWRFLLSGETWIQAYTQVFFSMSIGFGIMFAYGSFLDRETDIVKNAFIIGIADSLTAFVAGLAVFAALGHLALTGPHPIPISEWMGGSLGIAFIAYPKLISTIPLGFILGPLFFFMLLLLAIDSQFSLVEGAVKPLEDKFGWNHRKALLVVCGVSFVLGFVFMFQSGLYWFDTLDHFVNHIGIALGCLLECLAFGYVYRSQRIRAELLEHRENQLGAWWDWMIRLVAPVVLIALLAYEITQRVKGSYEGYGRVVEGLAGWGAIALIAILAAILTLLKGRDENETPD